ncbi:hypothetical protein FA15DRAFT_751697 [Coprinopsis marcescibilis]|uniref:Uncharacterized protein n=1 Tax=Coprinopsis marcescibilis TaxID=230819 RepID=A0A5C3LCX5_COPMA|nr:hypothetical protein FA15DRAFT_751697 [Coprinopsis marcescibilis]
MWCTRWFLPLLLLPLPTAPAYFLILFLFSLTLHAKPCFYCIVLLTTLFVSSCYWQPFPLETSLSTPWGDNITTFADALRSALSPNYTEPLPTTIRPADRCWCDLMSGSFFQPFNVSRWEHQSVVRLRDELERRQQDVLQDSSSFNSTTTPTEFDTDSTPRKTRSPLDRHPLLSFHIPSLKFPTFRSLWSATQVPVSEDPSFSSAPATPTPETKPAPGPLSSFLPFLQKEYDLRPYGLDLIIDFRWTQP